MRPNMRSRHCPCSRLLGPAHSYHLHTTCRRQCCSIRHCSSAPTVLRSYAPPSNITPASTLPPTHVQRAQLTLANTQTVIAIIGILRSLLLFTSLTDGERHYLGLFLIRRSGIVPSICPNYIYYPHEQ